MLSRERLRELIIDRSCPEPNTGCWLWCGRLSEKGYGRFSHKSFGPKTPSGRDRTRFAHRLSWVAFNGDPPAGLAICHRCDVPACVNPAHLFLGTHDDNMRDAQMKGRIAKRFVRRPDEDQLRIRAMKCRSIGLPWAVIARELGADKRTLQKLMARGEQ